MDGQIEVVINIKTSVQDKLIFQEKQKFRQWWLWCILIGITLIPIFGAYKQLMLDEPFGDNPMLNFMLTNSLFFIFALPVLFWLLELRTQIDGKGVHIQYFPFFKRSYAWSEIKAAKQINYGFVGGWGIRMGTKYGTVYNVRGNKGLFITLKSGKKFVVGTQRPKEMAEMLRKHQLK